MTKEEVQIALGIDSHALNGGLVNANQIIVKSMMDTAKSLTKLFAVNFTTLAIEGLRQWNTLTKTIANSWYDVENIAGRTIEKNRRADRAALIAAREAEKEATTAAEQRQKVMEKTNAIEDKVIERQRAKMLAGMKTEEERNQFVTEHLRLQEEIAKIEADRLEHFKNTNNLERRQEYAAAQLKLDAVQTEIDAENKRHAAVMKARADEAAAARAAKLDTQISTMGAVNQVGASSVYRERLSRLGRMAGEAKAGGDASRYFNLQQEMGRMQKMTPEQFVKDTLGKNTDLLQNLVDAVSKDGIKLLPAP